MLYLRSSISWFTFDGSLLFAQSCQETGHGVTRVDGQLHLEETIHRLRVDQVQLYMCLKINKKIDYRLDQLLVQIDHE